jgi:pimeloyl-ACP methyl ester carboxylesterase
MAYPLTAEVFVPEFTQCTSWRTPPSEARVFPKDVGAPPMLLLAGRHDPYTPLSGAQSLRAQLGNESELLVAEVEGHLALSRDDPIRREAVQFLADAR